MKFSYAWLQEYFDTPLPSVADLSRTITMHAFEIDGTEPHGTDTILDIKVLPNRSHDCFSYHGVAREIGALLDVAANIPKPHPTTDSGISTSDRLTLAVEDSRLVPRAMKRYVEGVTIGESPEWLKSKLAAHGQRSINNVVDATNLTMLETGQPVHAFDFDKLAADKKITIRSAHVDEVITTLDGKEFTLDPEILVISDSDKALDIAGVKGGSVSGIDANTTRIVLSVCNFDPVSIRKTSKKLGLRTDASTRFEQGIAPELTSVAMERLSALVEELAGGKVSHDVVDVYPNKKNLYVVGVSLSEINTALGTACSQEEVEAYFRRLDFRCRYTKPLDEIVSLAPTLVGVPYKLGASVLSDAPRLFDCSSFTSYLFGMSGVMIPRVSVDQYVFGVPVEVSDLKPGDLIFSNTGNGTIHQETYEYMQGTPVPEGVDHVGLYLGEGNVVHSSSANDNGVEIHVLANSPMFTNIVGYRRFIMNDEPRFIVTVPAPRIDIRIKEDLIEEVGRLKGLEVIPPTQISPDGFVPMVNKNEYYKALIRRALVDAGFSEVSTYAFQQKGEIEVANPLADDKKYLRGSLIDGVTIAIEMNKKNKPLLGTDMIRLFEIGTVFAKDSEHQEIAIVAEKPAEIDRACAVVADSLGVDIKWKKSGPIAITSLTDVLENLSTPDSYGNLPRLPDMTFAPISIYPFILRDIAVWITDGDAGSIPAIVRTHGGPLVARIDLFDTFTKEGRTSYAYHIVFQSHEKTLSDEEVGVIMKNIEDEIREKGWEVR